MDLVFVVIENNLRAMQSKMLGEDRHLLLNDLVNELNIDFPTLTIKEFELIIKDGIRGKYETETRGLSIVNFNYWAKAYQLKKSKLNLEIQKKIERAKADTPTIEKKLIKSDIIKLINSDFNNIKEIHLSQLEKKETVLSLDDFYLRGGLLLSYNFIYDQLIKFKLINIKQYNKELKTLQNIGINHGKKPEFTTFGNIRKKTLTGEAKRITCCKYWLNELNK